MAKRGRLGTIMLHAHFLHGTTSTTDSKPLLISMPHHICGHDRAWIYDTTWSTTGAMLQRDHAERHVYIDGMRLGRRIHYRRRTFGHHVGVHSGSVDELADLLGYCTRSEVLLRFANARLGHSCCALLRHDNTHWGELSIRERVPRQS